MAVREAPRVIRIEADRRGAGFSAPPALELGFAPHAVAFAAAGPGPFVLASGREGADGTFMPLDTLSINGDPAEASVDGGPTLATLALAAPDRSQSSKRQGMLWIVLLVAVAILAGLVWWLMRRSATSAQSQA